MAAGDVVITSDTVLNGLRLMTGTLVLDGGNPTPITLTSFMSSVLFGIVNMDGTAAPGVDPNYVTSNVSGTTLNVYAWKVNASGNATLIASTDNTRLVDWFAVGVQPAARV